MWSVCQYDLGLLHWQSIRRWHGFVPVAVNEQNCQTTNHSKPKQSMNRAHIIIIIDWDALYNINYTTSIKIIKQGMIITVTS